jgi:hypothetical protein
LCDSGSWQWGQDRPPVRRDPALALVTGRTHRNHQVLHQKGFVTFEARPRWDLGLDHLLFNVDPGCDFAAATPLLWFGGLRRFRRRGTLVHTAGFDVRAALQAFQTSNLFALFGDSLHQGANFTQQFDHQSFKRWTV